MNSPQYVNVPAEQAYKTPVCNSPLLPLLLISLATQKHAPKATTCVKDEYDFIVVGGGSAGSVVASRLSEDASKKVLLLEAGPLPPLLTEVPGFTGYFGESLDWNFKSVPQTNAADGKKEKKLDYPLGKMLGGCSSHNDMFVVRGNHKNYDDWEAQGAKGWSYRKVLRYFKKIEDFQIPKYFNSYYHGTVGYMTVTQPDYNPELKWALKKAAPSLESQNHDINAKRQTGFWHAYNTIRNGQRCSSAKGYLVPAENRANLDIFVNAQVTKVLIKNNQATGVEFYYGGGFQTVKAKKEVIVSAGSVNTPKLLMLSGVGPAAQLTKLNITVVANLPVGENFQDHPAADYLFTIKTPSGPLPDKLKNPAFIQEYIWKRSGPLASSGGLMYGVFLTDSTVNSTNDFPNLYLIIGENSMKFSEKGNFRPDVYKQFIEPYKDDNVCSCYVNGAQPKSRGTIKINSANPFDPPLIDPNYLSDKRDLDDLLGGIKFCQKILQTPSFKSINAKPFQTKVPDCEIYSAIEDEYLKCYAKTLLSSSYHGVGTCKMGDINDPTTVVDPHLRVKNVKGLRVVDASVMPTITSGNTAIPTMMIAEKASEMIKRSYARKKRNNVYNQNDF